MVAVLVQASAAGGRLHVSVTLFQAYPPAESLFLDGPCQVIHPLERRLSASRYRICLRGQSIVVSGCRQDGQRPVDKPELELLPGSRLAVCGVSASRQGGPVVSLKYSTCARRSYRGVVWISADRGALRVVNRVGGRDYVAAVVASETPPGFPPAALAAQAVLTQTRLARRKGDALLDDTTSSEAYFGQASVRADVLTAVQSVWGQVLTFRGIPIVPYYHSTCAGGTSNGEQYFRLARGTAPYLAGRCCSYCRPSPFWTATQRTIPGAFFHDRLGPGLPVVRRYDQCGRPLEVVLGNGRPVSGYRFWLAAEQVFGWDKVPGTRFSLQELPGGSVKFSSRGAGHGVGLCQWGARGLASRGKSARQILEYYFPGTGLKIVE